MTHRTFLTSETGAVTVDWVVLTAGLVGLGLAVMTVVSSGVQDLSTDVDASLHDNTIIRTSFATGPNLTDAFFKVLDLQGSGQFASMMADTVENTHLQQDTATLEGDYARYKELEAGYGALADLVRQQLDDTGTIDADALAALAATHNMPTETITRVNSRLNNDYGGDPTVLLAGYEAYSELENARAYAFEQELKRRGALPPS